MCESIDFVSDFSRGALSNEASCFVSGTKARPSTRPVKGRCKLHFDIMTRVYWNAMLRNWKLPEKADSLLLKRQASFN